QTLITQGAVNIQNTNAVGTGNVAVAYGATLQLQGGIAPTRSLVLNGAGINAVNTVQTITPSGTVNNGGTFTLNMGVGLGALSFGPITWNTSGNILAAAIQSALDLLLGVGNTLVQA